MVFLSHRQDSYQCEGRLKVKRDDVVFTCQPLAKPLGALWLDRVTAATANDEREASDEACPWCWHANRAHVLLGSTFAYLSGLHTPPARKQRRGV